MMTSQTPSPSQLRGPWLTIARVVWPFLAALALGIFISSVAAQVIDGGLIGPEIAPRVLASNLASFLALVAAALISLLLASVLFLRRANDVMALFLSFFLLVYAIVVAGPLFLLDPLVPGVSIIAWQVLQPILFAPLLVAFLSIFPNGRLVPYWTRWLIITSVLYAPVSVFLINANSLTMSIIGSLLWFTLIFAGLYAQIYRYRHVSNSTNRQQTKWVVYGMALALALISLSSIEYFNSQSLPPDAPRPWWAPLAVLGGFMAVSALPISLTFAVMRYRLYDIDILVNRTLVYGVLTGSLGLVYFVSVVVLQSLVRAISGQGESPMVTVLSTLTIAVLFTPLRRRIQEGIDRRFYRRKYDAEQVLAAFAESLRDEVDLDKLAEALLTTVEETMQPAGVSLWLAEPGRHTAVWDDSQ